MARTRVINDPRVTFTLPPTTTGHGFGSLAGSRASAGRQDSELHRFNGKKGPSGTNESLPATHGLRPIGEFLKSV